ncbi:alpha/beta hydrolase [Telmatocola sphagniphila]|uniref:Alpha/beta hydrolase n=1 Tax=Telmatocola sphagniphila TaxID=1123043 RepID=A0A8E6B3W8_9BACT|nr:alpha/beta hydrolase [Telmatocola sphagniphila]QVL30834.1 alpha/beta hydrolase [Telmatocola sphagniphila]
MASLSARIVDSLLRMLQVNRLGNHFFEKLYPYISTNCKPLGGLRRRHELSEYSLQGRPVYTIQPRDQIASRHVLYLHGGAYFNGFLPVQWQFVDRLITAANCSVTAPDTPLAPKSSSRDIFAMVQPIYEELLREVGSENLIVMGDSSGGGLALALMMKARDKGLDQPKDLILLSPWLDVTMTNPDIPGVAQNDPYLGLKACIVAGQRYAQEDDPTDPSISPIYGDLRGLCPIHLFVGTHDIMLPDCRKLRNLADLAGASLNYREYPKMIHDWMMLNLPESQNALQQIVAIVNSNGA